MSRQRGGARWRVGLLLLSATGASPALADQAGSQCAVPAPFVAIDDPQIWIQPLQKALPASHQSVFTTPVTLINYWAVWCPPCRKELPMLARMQETLVSSQAPASVSAVHVGNHLPAITATLEKLASTSLGSEFIEDFNAVRQLGFKGLPATVVTVNGLPQYRADGYLHTDPQVLTAWLTCLGVNRAQTITRNEQK